MRLSLKLRGRRLLNELGLSIVKLVRLDELVTRGMVSSALCEMTASTIIMGPCDSELLA
jgi:hypothetical protein